MNTGMHGRAGLDVSPLCLGIAFDTANVSSDGTSQEIVGRDLRDDAARDEIVPATEVHCPLGKRPNAVAWFA